ncbi:UNVERIFIED_CONTAM: hypothetical protein FKN15_054172 [Acipenser sinensis]
MVPPHHAHWAQRPHAGSQRHAKLSLAPPQHAHGPQRFLRSPSGSPNVPWHLCSTRTGPIDHARGLSGLQMVPGTSPARMGPSDYARGPSSLPIGTWYLPSMRTGPSDPAKVLSGSPNCSWHFPSTNTGLSDPAHHGGIAGGLVKGALSVAASAYKAFFTGQPVQPQQPVDSVNQNTTMMDVLVEMGFGDRQLNQRLLKKHNCNMIDVVNELVQMSDNDWYSTRY